LVGSGSDAAIEGTLGHWKTIADAWLESGLWDLFTVKGTPTFMFGDVEDPLFEQHVKEGPYVVLGDSANEKYKYDPRVVYIPGSPVPQSYMQHEMVEGMGFGSLYEPGLRMYEMATAARGRLTGVAGKQAQRGSVLKGVAAAAAIAVPVIALLASRGAEETTEETADESMHIADSEVGHVPE
jgi:hypothetical protein